MTNIIEFPKDKVVRETDNSVIEKAKERQTKKFADDIIYTVGETMYQLIASSGVDTESEKFDSDFCFMMEGLRASIYRSLSLPHPFHNFIDEHITFVTTQENQDFIKSQKESGFDDNGPA